MSSPTSFKSEDSSPSMSSTSPHNSVSWCPSTDDRNITRINIPQLPNPFAPQYTTASQTSQSTPVPRNATSSYTTASSLPPPSAPPFTTGCISIEPSAVEPRQRMSVTQLILQYWNMMDPEQKQRELKKAKMNAKMNRERYCRKVTSAPRGLRTAKNKLKKDGKLTGEIVQPREMYTLSKRPTPPSSKSRRPKRARSVGVDNRFPSTSRHLIIKAETPAHTPPSPPLSLPPQTSSMMQALSSLMISPLPHHSPTSLGFNNYAKDETLSPLTDNPDENTSYPIYDQMFAPHTQAFQSLHISSFSTGPSDTSSWTPPPTYQSPAFTMTEANPPRTLPQQAPLPANILTPPLLEQPQAVASNSSADDYDHPSCEVVSAEAPASFRTSDGYLVFNIHFPPEMEWLRDGLINMPDEFSQFDLNVGIDVDNTNLDIKMGDLNGGSFW